MGTYLGQNFLIDAKIRSYIADKILTLYHEKGCDALIEIGPGKGSITKLIQTISDNFFVIEKDETLIPNLKFQIPNLKLFEGDVLELDVEEMLKEKKLSPKKTLVVGNLPYYITSPILRKFFTDDSGGYGSDNFGGSKNRFLGGIFMVQDEVGQKVKSDARKKSYLRRLLNYAYDVMYLKGVSVKCFKPAPKVKSCLIQLTIKNGELKIDWEKLIEFLELFAPFNRKTLGAIQKMIQKKSGMNIIIPESLQKKRLEELTWKNLESILVS